MTNGSFCILVVGIWIFEKRLGHWDFEFGIYLEFGNWDLVLCYFSVISFPFAAER